MNQSNAIGFDFSMFVPSLMAGLGDSVNPCNFVTLLIFITVLSYFARVPLRIFLFGGLFIALAGGMHFSSVLGSWDQLLTLTIALNILWFAYLLIAIAFIFLGVVHICDWWQYKQHNDTRRFKIQLPLFFENQSADSSVSVVKRIFTLIYQVGIVSSLAVVLALTSSVYPQSEHVFIVHSFLMSGGNINFGYQSLGVYSFAMVLPLIIAWMIIWFLVLRKMRSVKVISFYKGILAALFMSTGIGLGYFFLN